ncbi:MAG: hypothetical protein IPH98_17530 [Saprospiraceae bacterium]|nr:hypothetical protein [Candidatus Defluviibacterium haderslevense]
MELRLLKPSIEVRFILLLTETDPFIDSNAFNPESSFNCVLFSIFRDLPMFFSLFKPIIDSKVLLLLKDNSSPIEFNSLSPLRFLRFSV